MNKIFFDFFWGGHFLVFGAIFGSFLGFWGHFWVFFCPKKNQKKKFCVLGKFLFYVVYKGDCLTFGGVFASLLRYSNFF